MTATPKKPFHETVADKLIAQLAQGTAPWQKPWQPGESGAFMPINPKTNIRYKGINALHLMSQGHADPRWMTYKQATSLGAQVRPGERGTLIQYWKFTEEQVATDAQGKPVLDAQGVPVRHSVKLERPRVFCATVFNAQQIDGLPPAPPRAVPDWNPVERAEQILQASGAVLRHDQRNRAFYHAASDTNHLPDKAQFTSAATYYATALHELGHWTGHPARLGRDLLHPFGSTGYAKEELRAEIASMILGDALGIGHDPGQHAAYVGSWIAVLQRDPLEIFRAAADAEKIFKHVRALAPQQSVAFVDLPGVPTDAVSPAASEREERAQAVPITTERLPMETNELEKAARFARATEERVRRDPASTDEDIAATKEVRKQAEVAAIKDRLERDGAGTGREAARPEHEPAAALPPLESEPGSEKHYLNVPFRDKEDAKKLGARWDRHAQAWYVPQGHDLASFGKWMQATSKADTVAQREKKATQEGSEATRTGEQRHYLAVPYGERAAAKAAGAVWDKAAKSWYAGPQADRERLARWAVVHGTVQQGPALPPREEFADALRALGCVVEGDHPIMDGRKHRIPVAGDKAGTQAGAGFYVGHLDGHPAGYVKNNRSGVEITWKYKGYVIDPAHQAQWQADAAMKRQAREAEQSNVQEAAAQRVARRIAALVPVSQATPYLQRKGLEAPPGVFTDAAGQKTYVPAVDVDGKYWTLQTIDADGGKRFARDSRKEGCFHAVGGLAALAAAPVLIISEGFATACSVSRAVGFATVAAFDAGNLRSVADALHATFPHKPVVVAGDDDQVLAVSQGTNVGKVKATEAARAVGGEAVFPVFAPGEQASDAKGFSDFNDLATKSALGHEAVARQLCPVIDKLVQAARIGFDEGQRTTCKMERIRRKTGSAKQR